MSVREGGCVVVRRARPRTERPQAAPDAVRDFSRITDERPD